MGNKWTDDYKEESLRMEIKQFLITDESKMDKVNTYLRGLLFNRINYFPDYNIHFLDHYKSSGIVIFKHTMEEEVLTIDTPEKINKDLEKILN